MDRDAMLNNNVQHLRRDKALSLNPAYPVSRHTLMSLRQKAAARTGRLYGGRADDLQLGIVTPLPPAQHQTFQSIASAAG